MTLSNLSGTIKNIVYQNKEGGYSVLRTTDEQTLCGTLNDVGVNLEGADFTATGSWQTNKKYGNQFIFEEFSVNESELFYFLYRIVKVLGRKLVKQLIEQYGEAQLEFILNETPEKLLTIKGIKHKKLKKIVANWHKFKELKAVAAVLSPYGATQTIVNKVYRHFQEDPDIAQKLKENPYLMTAVKGIGFKTADKITLAMGIPPDSPYRIKACIEYVLMDYTESQGNSCIDRGLLHTLINEELASTAEQLTISAELYQKALLELNTETKIVFLNEQQLTSSFLYLAENSILEFARAKGGQRFSPLTINCEQFIAFKENEMKVKFSDDQKKIIAVANEGYRFFILCGYAGTGKSTISKAILDLFSTRHQPEKIMCCALSGIAADRIRKTSGYQAATIQSLLVKAKNDGELPFEVVLLDEASMVNSGLLFQLLNAIKKDAVFIMVGDPAQLPPIGAGNPFHDLIQHKIVALVELTKIYRQSEDQVITYFANQIREARVPENYAGNFADFKCVDISIADYYNLKNSMNEQEFKACREANTEKIVAHIGQLAANYQPQLKQFLQAKDIANFITHFQVITPIKKGPLGAESLNCQLQHILNRQEDARKQVDLGFVKFNLLDKVVHITNQDMDCYTTNTFKDKDNSEPFRKRIFNGMIGVLFQLDKTEELLWVFYPLDDIVVEYAFAEARDLLRLAYALTIHKTQGSEYQNVIIPITLSHFIMLNNKLLYTAITRARNKCIVVGESNAFKSACKRQDVTVRETVLNLLV